MCTVVSSETGYCEDKVQKAVAHTILNRLKSDKFPNTMYEVVTQPNQYTAIHSYFDGQYRSGLYPGSDLWNNSMRLCIEAANEYDFTGNAYAYYNPSMIGYNAWFESLTLTYSDQFGRFFTW
jgi:N-acetylmuramoyl-L-alanine amidase